MLAQAICDLLGIRRRWWWGMFSVVVIVIIFVQPSVHCQTLSA
jgi:hypothetical protein